MVLACLAPLSGAAQRHGRELEAPEGKKQAPGFRMPSASGQVRSLADYRGKLLLLNFWATWCLPCREEMAALSRAQRKWGGKNVAIVGVAMDAQGWSKVTPFLKENPVDYEILLGSPRVARDYGAGRVYPTTVVVSPDGWIVGSVTTAFEEEDLERILSALVAEIQRTR